MQGCDSLTSTKVGKQSLLQWQQQCRQYLLTIEAQFDPSHQLDHVDRVLQNALLLLKTEPGDIAIILPAVMLHDCKPIAKNSLQRSQASTLSAQHATALLRQWQYPEYYLDSISHAIAGHSYSANLPTNTIEAKIVQDADRLDSLGAVGIARTCMLGGRFSSRLYHAADPYARNRGLDDKAYTIDHFYTKLLHLHSSFKTTSGRKIAKQRTAIMKTFIDNLANEAGWG